jgi:hypothetical protein
MKQAFDFTRSRVSQFQLDDCDTILVETSLGTIDHVSFDRVANRRKMQTLIGQDINGIYKTREILIAEGYSFTTDRLNNPWIMGNPTSGQEVFGYASGINYDLSVDDDQWLFGVEVEKEDYDMKVSETAEKVLSNTLWVKERDGSLGDTGFELKSPMLPLGDDKTIIDSFKSVEKYLNCASTEKCGGHINLSNKNESPKETVMRVKHSINLIYAMYPKRELIHYCQFKRFSRMINSRDKYQAIRMWDNRIEFRLFPAVETITQLKWRVGLVRILVSDRYSGMGLLSLLKEILNPKSVIAKHLSKVYSSDKLVDVCRRYVKFASTYGAYKNSLLAKCQVMVEVANAEQDSLAKFN